MAAAAFGGRVILSDLLAEFVHPCPPGPQRQLYRCQTDAEGRAVVCRDRCGHRRANSQSFVIVIPKIEFSLNMLFFQNNDWCLLIPIVAGLSDDRCTGIG